MIRLRVYRRQIIISINLYIYICYFFMNARLFSNIGILQFYLMFRLFRRFRKQWCFYPFLLSSKPEGELLLLFEKLMVIFENLVSLNMLHYLSVKFSVFTNLYFAYNIPLFPHPLIIMSCLANYFEEGCKFIVCAKMREFTMKFLGLVRQLNFDLFPYFRNIQPVIWPPLKLTK